MVFSRHTRIAYRLLRMAALDDRVQALVRKYPRVDEETIRDAATIDPTQSKGSYLEWVVNRINLGDIHWPDQKETVARTLKKYGELKRSSTLMSKFDVKPDIGSYFLNDLTALVERVDSHENKVRDAVEVVYDTPPYKVIKISAERAGLEPAVEAACALAQGTQWCTITEWRSKNYLADGPLYIVYRNRTKLLQTDGREIKDASNQAFDFDDNPDVYQLLAKLGVISRASVGYQMAMAGGEARRVPEFEDDIMRDPQLAVAYAFNVLEEEWPEAEPFIIKDPKAAGTYALDLRGREWPEAESVIMQDPGSAANYAIHVLRRRWPEAEPSIVRDKFAWTMYLQRFYQEITEVHPAWQQAR